LPKPYNVTSPPNQIEDTRSLQSWQELFKARRAWALKIVDDCTEMAYATQERGNEMDVIFRCLEAAVANLVSVVKSLETRYTELHKWIPDAQAEYTALTTGWEQYLSLARSIPVSSSMVRFMTGRDMGGGKGRPQRQATLEDIVDLDTARRAGRSAPSTLRKFNGRAADLEKTAERLFQDADRLFRDFERTAARSDLRQDGESLQLLQDIEAVARKIETDYQTTLDYSNSTRDVLQASKIAANHTERLLPSIKNRALEMDEMLRYATQSRNDLAAEAVDFMRNITDITALSHSVKGHMTSVSQEEDLATFDYLRLIHQVPYMYAAFLAEAIKRREWFEKVKQDSSTLANEMAVFQDEELKRRRRWHKQIGDSYGHKTPGPDGNVPGLEVNLLGEDDQWPATTRKDLGDFYELLQKQKTDPELLADVAKLITELSNQTKQQSKRVRAFKNGSVHEAALGRSGLLIRGDDDLLRSLQDDKSKLESKLKTAESRVRRLEDLLHRQSQASRPSLGNLFQTPSQQGSERNDSLISVKSPRTSEDYRRSSDGENVLMQRVQQLENDLRAEKERSAAFEKDLDKKTTQHNDIKGQMDEANSTKKDLLENLEALKREFMEERKDLEDKIKRLQARLEDTEDEIEHFGESRENEKATYDERLHALEMENQRLLKDKHDEALKSEGQVEFLRKESRLQRERVASLEKLLQASQEEANRLAKRLDDSEETGEAQLRTLRDVYEQLSPNEAIPAELNDLIEGLLGRIAEFLAKVNSVEGDMALIRSDLELADGTIKDLRGEVAAAREKLSEREVAEMHLEEKLSREKAKASALEQELAEGREQLDELRARLADGETGSESLRKKLEEDETRIASMTEELASRQCQVGSLEEELLLFKERLLDSQSKLAELTARFDARTERAKDLTQRLYSQNDRLCRLLERLGFSIAREGDSMVIQKVPRSERSSQTPTNDLFDPGSSSLRKSGTLNSRVLADSTDMELQYWMNAPGSEGEAEKYKAFLSGIGSFDTDAFSEAVYKRVKDVEYMARKLQRDARSYREKAHTLQKDAHDKIAFKNFKEGDLALFLPTRNQTTGAWAAFNVGFPHYFLREQEGHRLRSREWLVARISKIQERVVDLSKSLQPNSTSANKDGTAVHETDSINDDENDNPFDLSDGLRWYLIDAQEDKPGAPSTPGLGKSTVAANKVDAMADMHTHGRTNSKGSVLGVGRGLASSGIQGVSKSLSKSLESRRSSTGSRKALPFAVGVGARGGGRDSAAVSETNSLRAAPGDTPVGTSPTQHHAHGHLQQHGRPSTPLAAAHGVDEEQDQETNEDGGGDGAGDEHGNGNGILSTSPAVDDGPNRVGQSAQQGGSEVRNVIDTLLGP
jgi:autophagy-related protein 11